MSCSPGLYKSDFQAHVISEECACARLPTSMDPKTSVKTALTLTLTDVLCLCELPSFCREKKDWELQARIPQRAEHVRWSRARSLGTLPQSVRGQAWLVSKLPPRTQLWASTALLNPSFNPHHPYPTLPACSSPGVDSLMGPRAVSAPDCLRSLGNSERKPFKSACLEFTKPAELGQTLPWVSLRGDSGISKGSGEIWRNANRARGQQGWNLCFHWTGDIFHLRAWCKSLLVFSYLQAENINTAIKIFHLSQMRPCTDFLLCAKLSAASIWSTGRHPNLAHALFEVKLNCPCGRQGRGQGRASQVEVKDDQWKWEINKSANQSQWFFLSQCILSIYSWTGCLKIGPFW